MYVPSKILAFFLGFFLGGLGLHQIYLRRYGPGIVWLIVFFLFSWTVVVPIFLAIVGALHGISFLFWNDEDWARVYGDRFQN